MVTQIQDSRPVKIKTPLPDNSLLFSSMSAVEHLSELFEYKVELLSPDFDIDLNELLGRDMTIYLNRPDGGLRYFHGHVCDGAQLNPDGEQAVYSVTLKPWLWFLTRTTDCRIFQDMSVPDILDEIFRGEGFTDFETQLNEVYPSRNYCVQYGESDFDFVSRLMEQEGIYYYFRHEDAKHTLVLCDNVVAHNNVPGYESISLHNGTVNALPDQEYFEGLSVKRQVLPGSVVTNDFNFVQPGDNMLASSEGQGSHAHASYEVYDYSGEYPSQNNGVKARDFGERVARFRMEALQATHEVITLQGQVCGPGSGDLFVLSGADRVELNREYLIVGSRLDFSQGGFGHSDSEIEFQFNARMQVMCAKVQYRAPRKAKRPVMQGPQTAIVVGPAGEEIFTDKHGRVKLQFHWDRYGQSDENSSCWVRVSQVWAGGQYGAIHIPRINNEVIVEFINGDPDQPIVTGRVYNGDNSVPYDLPANATQSGIKSRSSLGGNVSNFNEIRMEDKKGQEELYLHAERNHTQLTKVDRSESVGNDRSLSVGNDKTETVGANRTLTVSGNKDETVESNKEIRVHGTHIETIKGDTKVDITKGDFKQTVKKGFFSLFSLKKLQISTDNKMELMSKSDMQVESNTQLTLKVGSSQIVLTPGKIQISADEIEINGSSKVVSMSGGANEIKGGTIAVGADSSVSITGSSVSVN